MKQGKMPLFTPITNVNLLKDNDIVIIPTDKDHKRGRHKDLHLNALHYRSLGLSVGDTCRASNRTSDVRALLSLDNGESKMFFIWDVYMEYTGVDNNILALGGNSSSSSPMYSSTAKIKKAYLLDSVVKPSCNDPDSYYLRELESMVINRFLNEKVAANIIKSLGLKKNFILGSNLNESTFSKFIYSMKREIPHTKDALPDYQSSSGCLIPETYQDIDQSTITPENFISFLTVSSGLNQGIGLHHKYVRPRLECPAKFLESLLNRGAKFYRPAPQFYEDMLIDIIMKKFEMYSYLSERIDKNCEFSLKIVKAGVSRLRNRNKLAKTASKKAGKIITKSATFNALKEMM